MTEIDRAEVLRVRDEIRRVVDDPRARRLVAAYYEPSPRDYPQHNQVLFAGARFDELDSGSPHAFTSADLAAAALLDVRFDAQAVHTLIEGPECAALLGQIPASLDLWNATDEHIGPGSPAAALWASFPRGFGKTRKSKILARKRPRLMPILDSVVVSALHLDNDRWRLLRDALQDENGEVVPAVDDLSSAATQHGARPPSTLRLLDVVTWMRFSKSRSALAVRDATGYLD